MAYALQFDGATFARAVTLGNLLSSKLTITSDYFRWGGGSGTMFSQCVNFSGDKEFQIFENGGNLWVAAGGASNEFGSVASIFGAATFEGKLKFTLDFVAKTLDIELDDVSVFNQSLTIGTGRIANARFRFGARGDSASASDTGGFFAPSGTLIGDTSIEIDDVLVRRYVSSGSGSSWADTESAQNATVDGTATWSEYGTVTPGDILTITSPTSNKVFNWNNNTSEDIDFTVSFTGSPASIERSIDGGSNWSVAATSPSSPLVDTVTLPAGQYDVHYRFASDTSVTDSVTVGVGPVIPLIGHSNIVQYGDNNQALTPSSNGVNAFMYGLDGSWKVAVDPVHSNAGIQYSVGSDDAAGGTAWIMFANQWLIDNPDIPIAFIPCAKGGSVATDWTYNTSTNTLYGAMRARISAAASDNVDSFMCGFGGNEARFDVSYSDLQTTLNSIRTSLVNAYNADMYFMPLQNYTTANRPVGDGRTNGKVAMSSAVQDFVASHSDCFMWATVFFTDLDVGPNTDGVHFRTDSQLTDLFNASYSAYTRGETECEVSIPSATDGIYTLELYDPQNNLVMDEPIYIESGIAHTSAFQLDPSTALTGTVYDGTDTYTVQGLTGGTISEEAANQPPTANAGVDQSVAAGVTVQLDGTGSTDGDGTIVSYSWAQTAGDAVILTGASTSTPSFTAPSTNAQQTLTFELTVTDNEAATDTDTVDVVVAAAENIIRPFINNASRNFNFVDKDGLWTDNLRVTEVDSYTLTIDPNWISPESIVSYSVTPKAGLTVVDHAREDNVIQVYISAEVVGRTNVRFDFETATRSDHVVVSLDVIS